MKSKKVYIVGSKGIPASYGGFETFVEELTARKKNQHINYYIGCMNEREERYIHNESVCFNVKTDVGGAFGKMLQVCDALKCVLSMVDENEDSIVYILGCRIGPFLYYYRYKLKRKNPDIKIMVNPDGMEWRRSKWRGWQKVFLKFCEGCLVRNADYIVADSLGMQKIIEDEFNVPKEKIGYIAYGAEIPQGELISDKVDNWYKDKQIKPMQYYLIVGRFVPENNYEVMIREFMSSNVDKKLVIISNVEQDAFWEELKNKTNFEQDDRIVFAGTVYDKTLLTIIRQNAFAYIHGHEVGGTNPSLLEALATTKVNLLLGVSFNREVGGEAAFYYDKEEGCLAKVIEQTETLSLEERDKMGTLAKQRIREKYSWDYIVDEYERLFMGEK